MPARSLIPAMIAAVLAALILAAPMAAFAQDPANPDCPARFQFYETAARLSGPNTDRRRAGASRVRAAARWLRMGDCLTFADQLAPTGMLGLDAGVGARQPAGPTIPPTYLHAGIVTSSEDEARVVDFFARQGLRARGVGAEYLGRRIYVGPFTTLGALEGGASLARAAGLAYPYPSRF